MDAASAVVAARDPVMIALDPLLGKIEGMNDCGEQFVVTAMKLLYLVCKYMYRFSPDSQKTKAILTSQDRLLSFVPKTQDPYLKSIICDVKYPVPPKNFSDPPKLQFAGLLVELFQLNVNFLVWKRQHSKNCA